MRTFKQKTKASPCVKSASPGRLQTGQSREVNSVLQLQRTIGNRAVRRMAQTGAQEPEVPSRAHEALRSPGQALDLATRSLMEPRFGYDFSQVRMHVGAAAARSARDVNASAYTIGRDIVFAAGRLAPDTNEGQHLLAREFTHVVQQSGEAGSRVGHVLSNVVQRQPYYEKSESDVVESVIEALQTSNKIAGLNVDPAFDTLNQYPLPFQVRVLTQLYDRGYFHGLLGYLAPGTKADRKLIVAIRLVECQRDPSLLALEEILEADQFLKYDVTLPSELKPMLECLEREKEAKRFAAAFERGSDVCALTKGVMQWHLYSATSAGHTGKKQRMQIKFRPGSSYRNKTVTFLQTVREEGGGQSPATVDIGMNREAFRPFYGANWDQATKQWVASNEGRDVGFRSQPSTAGDPAAYLFDEPYFFPPPHGRVFESVAVVPETGEVLGALTWGVGTVPAYAQSPKCAETPSSEYQSTVEKFYTPKDPARGHGQENYDVILDRFAANDAALSAEQKKQLDSIAARAKEMISSNKGDPKSTDQHLVIGAFGDSMDKDPMAASEQRAQAVATYITSRGVRVSTLDVRTFGATWARYEVGTKKAQEGRNRRVQIRLFVP